MLQKGTPKMSTHRTVIKHKVGLLRLAQELGNVSQACKVMGYSRDTFYRYQQAVEEGGVEALLRVPTRFVRKYTLRAKASALDPDVLLDRPRRRRWPWQGASRTVTI